MEAKDCQQWWMEPETQKITIDLAEKYPIQIITSALKDGEIVVKVVTFDGKPIEGFPKDIRGKGIIMGSFDILG